MPDEPGTTIGGQDAAELSALSELVACENLAQVSAWVARWCARAGGAQASIVWTFDPTHPLMLATGTFGANAPDKGRRSVSREEPLLRDVLRDRRPRVVAPSEAPPAGLRFGADPSGGPPPWTMLVPVATRGAAPGVVVAVVALSFEAKPDAVEVDRRLAAIVRHAAAALERSSRSENRSAGMLRAIERLTSLYDVSKAFGSTIEWGELADIIVRKAVDFAGAEAGSLWLLEDDESATLAGTAVNENYDCPSPPEAVGADVVGDLLADRVAIRRNRIPEPEPNACAYAVRSILGVVMTEDERPIGALVVANKRGRSPDFTSEDEELLEDLSRQAVRALRNARTYEAEKKVEELDALLAVSREITATLDLDRVMQTIVNASAALIRYDRCAIAIQQGGRLRVGAVSGMAEIDRKSAEIRRTEELLQWVYLSRSDVNVTEAEGGFTADRPETEEKFRALFRETDLKAYYAVILKDEEGQLGVLAFESREPIVFDEETRDLLQILVNQATVAVRNAQLYQQVPLAGFWKPLLEKRRRLLAIPRRRRLAWGLSAVLVAAVLFFVPWRLRVGGPARILPGHRAVVAAGVDGIVASVRHREGDVVPQGEIIATLNDESYRAALADAQAAYANAESDVAKQQSSGNVSALFEAQTRADELKARIAMEQQRFDYTLLRAPAAGVIVTPRLEERVGQNFLRGAEFCVVADVGTVNVEVAVPEEDSSLVQAGQAVDVKVNPYPTRSFHGRVTRVGAHVREEGGDAKGKGEDRFVIAEVEIANGDGALKTGMLGRAKIRAGSRSIITLLLRRPARWLFGKVWPLLP